MREIALDTETTGIGALEGHRIIEIGAVEMINHFRTGNFFHVYINPKFKVSEGAFKVHGISDEFLKDKPLFKEIAANLLDFIGESKLVIHNAPFDLGFLNHHFHELGISPIHDDKVIDTLPMARKKYPGAKNSLDGLCNRFNIDLSGREKHGALLDAELLADVYAEMVGVGSTQRNMLFSPGTTQISIEQSQQSSSNKVFREPRIFGASAEELAAHDEFTAKLKNALWKKPA